MNSELEKIIIKIETDVLTYAEKELLKKTLNECDKYYKALCDIENGEDVRKVLERTLT